MDSPIRLTESATSKVKELGKSNGSPALKLRVFVTGGGSGPGFQYGLVFDEEVGPDDTIIEKEDVTLLIDPYSFIYLNGAEIDYAASWTGPKFVIRQQNPEPRSRASPVTFGSHASAATDEGIEPSSRKQAEASRSQMTTNTPRKKTSDLVLKIIVRGLLVALVASGLWVGYQAGGWMWLVAPAVGVLWFALLFVGCAAFVFIAAAHDAKRFYWIIFPSFFVFLGLLGYFARWALTTF